MSQTAQAYGFSPKPKSTSFSSSPPQVPVSCEAKLLPNKAFSRALEKLKAAAHFYTLSNLKRPLSTFDLNIQQIKTVLASKRSQATASVYHTCMNEDMSLEVISTSKCSVTMITNKIFLYFGRGAVLISTRAL